MNILIVTNTFAPHVGGVALPVVALGASGVVVDRHTGRRLVRAGDA